VFRLEGVQSCTALHAKVRYRVALRGWVTTMARTIKGRAPLPAGLRRRFDSLFGDLDLASWAQHGDGYKEIRIAGDPWFDDKEVLLATAGEIGEIINARKKILRDGDSAELRGKIAEEIVDTVIYVVRYAQLMELDLNLAWQDKVAELMRRYG
jgi:NTP pyrophosphatase (non-canonical NTP hydrolase)